VAAKQMAVAGALFLFVMEVMPVDNLRIRGFAVGTRGNYSWRRKADINMASYPPSQTGQGGDENDKD